MKKLLTFLLASVLCAAALSGCSQKAPEQKPSDEQQPSVEAPAEEPTEAEEPSLDDIVSAVKEAYGENYLPSMAMDEQMLQDVCGITMEDVEEFYAEGPMMSGHIDTFIVLKAKEGKVDSLAQELQTYLDQQQNDALCYPENGIRIQSATVLTQGNYAFYMMLGGYDNDAHTEEEIVKYADEMTKLGVDTVEALFK